MPYAPVREQWMDDAACTQNDPEWWFPEDSRPAAYAKSVCAGCPVAKQCLEYALRENIRDGVYGGLAPKERAALRRSTAA